MSRDAHWTPASSLAAAAEIARTGILLREAFMQSRREELLATYQNYIDADKIEKPKFNVILFGFQEAWRELDYRRIVVVGDKLTKDFLLRWREVQAYYALALAKLGREKLRLT